jgi:site-specific recombinase XerD
MRRPKACPFRRSDGTYWARVRYVDESGKTRDEVARAESPADARAKSIELVKKYDIGGDSQPQPITFNKFAELFIPHIEGLSSHKTALGFLHTLRGHFGRKQLSSITYKDIQEYSKKRSKAVSSRTGKRLKRASVNREIALLSRMFKEAIEQGFVLKNPCKEGPQLIRPEEETKRDRILSAEEEESLLAACTGRRSHLRPVIMATLGTGATKSQLMRLTWGDLHIGLREMTVRAPGKKTVKVRISDDLANVLAKLQERLLDEYSSNPSLYRGEKAPLFSEWIAPKRVFRDFKSAFSSACRAAKIKDLRFNDLRRTSATRRKAKIERVKAAFAKVKRDSEESAE